MLAKSFSGSSCPRQGKSKQTIACSGGQHLNLILPATLGTYHGDNRWLTLSTRRMRTSLSRHTKFASFGVSMSPCLLPSQMTSQNRGGYPSTETCIYFLEGQLSLYALCEVKLLLFPPQKGLPDLWSQESCLDHSQLWKPTHLEGLLSHTDSSAPSPRILDNLKCFFQCIVYATAEWRSITVYWFHTSDTASCSVQ